MNRRLCRLCMLWAGMLVGLATLACEPDPAMSRRVLLIGIDGASWKVIEPMLADGELPTFQRLVSQGATCPDVDVAHRSSPVAWTSIATGRLSQHHGILNHITKLPNGDLIPVTGANRRVKAIWDVASAAGRTVGVVGWWASWPAEPVRGFFVSDHANPVFVEKLAHDRGYWTADRQKVANLNKDYYPPTVGSVLAGVATSKEDFSYDLFAQRTKITPKQRAKLEKTAWYEGDRYDVLRTFFLIDLNQVSASLALLQRQPVDLALVYLRAMDPIQHKGWDLVEPERFQRRKKYTDDPETDRGLVESAYRHTDAFLDELIRAVPEDTTIVVMSDHGAEPHPSEDSPRPGGHHSPDARGVLFIAGPGVRAKQKLTRASPYDVMPTILWLLGLPIAEDLEGRILTEAFDPSFADQIPVIKTATYGARESQAIAAPSDADEAMLESLRTLGYIE